jgi:hypothetical protein
MAKTADLTKPTIHLNGTSAEALRNQYAAAHTAVEQAITALSEAAPHGRDYYVRGGSAYAQAAMEHSYRMNALTRVRDELLELHDACDGGAHG